MKTVNTDGLEVTQDEALEFAIHHLRLAALFFEAGPDSYKIWEEEIKRILSRGLDTPAQHAALDWLSSIHRIYEKMKVND